MSNSYAILVVDRRQKKRRSRHFANDVKIQASSAIYRSQWHFCENVIYRKERKEKALRVRKVTEKLNRGTMKLSEGNSAVQK